MLIKIKHVINAALGKYSLKVRLLVTVCPLIFIIAGFGIGWLKTANDSRNTSIEQFGTATATDWLARASALRADSFRYLWKAYADYDPQKNLPESTLKSSLNSIRGLSDKLGKAKLETKFTEQELSTFDKAIVKSGQIEAKIIDLQKKVVEQKIPRDDLKNLIVELEDSGEDLLDSIEECLNSTRKKGGSSTENATAIYQLALKAIAALFSVAMLFGIVAIIAAFKISSQIKQIKNIAESISHGDVNVEINIRSSDEIGQLSKSFQKTIVYLKNIASYLNALSERRLDIKVDLASQGDYLGNALRESFKDLNNTLTKVLISSDDVTQIAHELKHASDDIATGAMQQTELIEDIAGELNFLSKNLTATSQHSKNTVKAAADSKIKIEEGASIAEATAASMKLIMESSSQIKGSLKLINDIAFQTNVLALNAAVEAAHAGKYGKGFAIVADEVRTLANKSDMASKQIEHVVTEVEKTVQTGENTVTELKATLLIVADVSHGVANEIVVFDTDLAKQAIVFEEMLTRLEKIRGVVHANTAAAEQSAAATNSLADSAVSLKRLMETFSLAQ